MYGVVWGHNTPECGNRQLLSAPESLDEITSTDQAKVEGRQILAELAPEHKTAMKPLAVVEVTEEMMFALKGCERVFLPMDEDDGELEFVDVSKTQFWNSQPWWPK